MKVSQDSGLYREILTTIKTQNIDPKFNSFSIGDPFYATYVNIGVWESVEKFDMAVGKYIPNVQVMEKNGRVKQLIELETFEFKMRERIVLEVVSDRGGGLPPANLLE